MVTQVEHERTSTVSATPPSQGGIQGHSRSLEPTWIDRRPMTSY